MAATRRKVWIGVFGFGLLWWRVAAASFHVDAGELTFTLNEWSRQSDLQILFDFNVLRGHSSLPVSCECSAKEALALLLQGSGFIFDFVNDRTVAVTADAGIVPASSAEFARWLRGFEKETQSYAEGTGPPLLPLIIVLPDTRVMAAQR